MRPDHLIADFAAALGLYPAPLAPVAHGPAPRDPSLFGKWCKSATPIGEHFMNTVKRSTTMWRNSDPVRPPARPATRHAGYRPRITAGQRLAQALFDRAGPLARLVRHGETQWASATFTGARHTFVMRFQGAQAVDAAEHLTAMIADDDITIQGALIADITITRFTQTMLPQPEAEIEISALLLDQ